MKLPHPELTEQTESIVAKLSADPFVYEEAKVLAFIASNSESIAVRCRANLRLEALINRVCGPEALGPEKPEYTFVRGARVRCK